MLRKLTCFGMIGAVLYAAHVVLGGILWKGYNHLMQPISDLTASGAPNARFLSVITFIYGLCSILFAFSAFIYIKSFAPRPAAAGMAVFLAMHLVSITYGLFPQDLPGAPATFTGTMHLVVTALIVPLTIAAPVLMGAGFRKLTGFKSFGTYSILTGIAIFIFGGTSAILFAGRLPFFGLAERLNIGTLQLWMFLLSLKLFKDSLVREDATRPGYSGR